MLKDDFFIASQYILPHHLLSRVVGKLASCENRWVKNQLIQRFMRQYGVQLDEAVHQHPQDYKSFNDFFTRALLPDARPLDERADSLLSPCDGAVSQIGHIQRGKIFQAKGQEFSLTELLGGDRDRAEPFVGGKFATLYLSPKDYHRVHMPMAGTLKEMVYVPGSLFSVNQTTAERVPGLFARNERLVCIFETEHGPMAMVLVGAMIVAAIETVWAGRITPPERKLKVFDFADPQPVDLARGAEMGRFCLGSTVVLCFPDQMIDWSNELQAGTAITMGSRIGSVSAVAATLPDTQPAEAKAAEDADEDAKRYGKDDDGQADSDKSDSDKSDSDKSDSDKNDQDDSPENGQD
ncbi:archaetidylserine decarboxylase [Oceanobacter kriegii]|uniref:archaetidylserine decarboxylase n=1 Tax=Oceanobacter kriegii TaxID=64972 RepID=UPI000400866A|nr:archaetidylserine decarboxylase [Oceanobacter kriegii]